MAEGDGTSHFESEFDIDAKGQFLKGKDGYALGESLDFHDLDGRQRDDKKAIPRIIGKTNPKTEHLTEGHPGGQRLLTIEDKVQK